MCKNFKKRSSTSKRTGNQKDKRAGQAQGMSIWLFGNRRVKEGDLIGDFCIIGLQSFEMLHRKRRQVGVRSKYAKIPVKTKLKFLRKVLLEGFSIRDASTLFNINYSTAKTLIRQHKASHAKLEATNDPDETDPLIMETHPRIRCCYRQVRVEGEEKAEPSSNGTSFYLWSGQDQSEEGKCREREVSELVPRVQIISSCNYR